MSGRVGLWERKRHEFYLTVHCSVPFHYSPPIHLFHRHRDKESEKAKKVKKEALQTSWVLLSLYWFLTLL